MTLITPGSDIDAMRAINERFHHISIALRKEPIILGFQSTGTTAGALAEQNAPDNVFDGTSTPATLFVESASVNDTNTGGAGHVEKVKIIGIDENDEITTEEVELDGTTAVETTKKWKRVFHFFATEWGSGGDDAAGAITLGDDAVPTTTYLTILINTNHSNGCAFWIPTGWKGIPLHTKGVMTTMSGVTTSNILFAIKKTTTDKENPGADPDLNISPAVATAYSPVGEPCPCIKPWGAAKYTPLAGDEGNANDYNYVMKIALWEA